MSKQTIPSTGAVVANIVNPTNANFTELYPITTYANLRNVVGTSGEIRTVGGRGATPDNAQAGQFIWREGSDFATGGNYADDNDGTIIKAAGNDTGRWVRIFDGWVSVGWFGALGTGGNYTTMFQNAIDFCAINALNNPRVNGTTLYIPSGNYLIDNLTIKDGVSIIGDSSTKPVLTTTAGTGYMLEMSVGRVRVNIENLQLVGNHHTKGCMLLEAQLDGSDGGLWYSRFKNINILQFSGGHGLYLKGGGLDSDYMLPNQFCMFENIIIKRQVDDYNCLRLTGQNAQHIFINCQFDGTLTGTTYQANENVYIGYDDKFIPSHIKFITCTTQQSEIGYKLEANRNIDFDHCWFEGLGNSLDISSAVVDGSNTVQPQAITINNAKFANAGGFGGLTATNDKTQPVIKINDAFVSVTNCFENISGTNVNYKWIAATNMETTGIVQSGNFNDTDLAETTGMTQTIALSTNTINLYGHSIVLVTASATVIKTIASLCDVGNKITVIASGGSINFDETDNIVLGGVTTLVLADNETATFVRTDNGGVVTYRLI